MSRSQLFRSFVEYLVVFVIILIFLAMVLPSSSGGRASARSYITRRRVSAIAAALVKYSAENGKISTNNVELATILNGASPKKIVYLEADHSTNLSGEMVDDWGTPLRIEMTDQTNFIVRSAGRNRKFGDKDDIWCDSKSNVSWKAMPR